MLTTKEKEVLTDEVQKLTAQMAELGEDRVKLKEALKQCQTSLVTMNSCIEAALK